MSVMKIRSRFDQEEFKEQISDDTTNQINQAIGAINVDGRSIFNRSGIERKPMLVMTYDDGLTTDYTQAFAVHESYGVPFTVGVVSMHVTHPEVESIIASNWQAKYITKEQLDEIAASEVGHEIASHGMTHRLMGVRRLASPANSSDSVIQVTNQAKYFTPTSIEDPIECFLIEGDTKEIIFVESHDEANQELNLTSPLENSFSTEAYIRLSDSELHKEVVGSKEALESLGYEIDGILYPGARHCYESRMLKSQHYIYGRGVHHQEEPSITQPTPFPTYGIGAPVMENSTLQQIEDYMDEAVSTNGALFLIGHTGAFSDEFIGDIIEAGQARGMDIVTAREAVNRIGNMVEVGDTFQGRENHNFPKKAGFFAVNYDNKVYPDLARKEQFRDNTGDLEFDWVVGHSNNNGAQSQAYKKLTLEAEGSLGQRTYASNIQIDLTDVNKIRVDWENVGDTVDVQHRSYLTIANNNTGSISDFVLRIADTQGSFRRKVSEIDTSELTGEHYIRVHAYNTTPAAPGKKSILHVYGVWGE